MVLATQWQMSAVAEELVAFVHRVAPNENASPAEIMALPEIAKQFYFNVKSVWGKSDVSLVKREQMKTIRDDLIAFVHRVAPNENASPAEIAALPEIVKLLCCDLERIEF